MQAEALIKESLLSQKEGTVLTKILCRIKSNNLYHSNANIQLQFQRLLDDSISNSLSDSIHAMMKHQFYWIFSE